MITEPHHPTEDPLASKRLTLPARLRALMAAAATRAYPAEACGLLVGRASGSRVEVVRVAKARNRATTPTRYDLDPEDFVAADLAARNEGLDIVGIWHSHPDHPAIPSQTDLDRAWSGYSYVILSIRHGKEEELRSWRLEDGGFREELLENGSHRIHTADTPVEAIET